MLRRSSDPFETMPDDALNQSREDYISTLVAQNVMLTPWDNGRLTRTQTAHATLQHMRDSYIRLAGGDLDLIAGGRKELRRMLSTEATARHDLIVENLGEYGLKGYDYFGFTRKERKGIITEATEQYPTSGFEAARYCLRLEISPEEAAITNFVDLELRIAGEGEA